MTKQALYFYLMYLLSHIPIIHCHELPIVVLICSYNNQEWVEKNLDSVFMQNYENYRIVYIDDCSKDATSDYVQSYINAYHVSDKVTFVSNQQRCRKMKNIYTAIHSFCDDQEIIVQLDGDDWFIDDHLFAQINELYQTKDVWLTYGSDTLHYAQPTSQKTILESSYRKQKWIYAPTRTFYAWLFKAIKVQDLIAESVPGYQGHFFPSADDVAFMYPMLEMAGTHCVFINHTNYEVNTHNPLSNKKIEINLQDSASADVRSRMPYKPLLKAKKIKDRSREFADICLVSDNADQLKTLLNELSLLLVHYDKLCIFFTHDYAKHHDLVTSYAQYQFYQSSQEDVFQDIQRCAQQSTHPYMLLMHTGIQLTEQINLSYYMQALEKTGAYGFYFAFSSNETKDSLQHLFDEVYAWKLAWCAKEFWSNQDMTLLRTQDIVQNYCQDQHAVGLCSQKNVIAHYNKHTCLELELQYPLYKKKSKKRRLHVPGVDSRTQQKKSRIST